MTSQSEHLYQEIQTTERQLRERDEEIARLQDQRDAWRRLAEARDDLLVCYRMGVGSGDRRAERAMIRIDNAKGELRRLGVDVEVRR